MTRKQAILLERSQAEELLNQIRDLAAELKSIDWNAGQVVLTAVQEARDRMNGKEI